MVPRAGVLHRPINGEQGKRTKTCPRPERSLGHDRGTDRNRRATNHRSHLVLIPLEKLFSGRNDILVYKEKSNSVDTHASADPFAHALDNPLVVTLPQRRPGPDDPHWKIATSEWSTVLHRIDQGE